MDKGGFRQSAVHVVPGPEPAISLGRLDKLTKAFNPEKSMVRLPAYGMGYFTRLKGGEAVHPIRETMEFVYLATLSKRESLKPMLLESVSRVLDLQCLDKDNKYYGLWPWFEEEPLTAMDQPDRNWAEFISAFIVDLLAFRKGSFPSNMESRLVAALEAACSAIMQRNVGPNYTNICAMDAAVMCSSGLLLENKEFFKYGKNSLKNLYYRCSGFLVFDEYNSPAYTPILIEELDRLLRIVDDAKCRKMAAAIRLWAWKGISHFYHRNLDEWGGAQSRTYLDRMGSKQRQFLEEKAGLGSEYTSPQPCPDVVREQFLKKIDKPKHVRLRTPDGRKLTLWKSHAAMLGSVDDEQTWVQRRPIIAHLKGQDNVDVFRVRVMCNGRDYAGARLLSKQDGTSLIGALMLSIKHGIWHAYMDRPENDLLEVDDLRIRFEIQGKITEYRKPKGDGMGLLSTDRFHIQFYPTLTWLGLPIDWQVESQNNEDLSDSLADDDNWFPTRSDLGCDVKSGTWIDGIVRLDERRKIRISEWTFPSFAFGLTIQDRREQRSGLKRIAPPRIENEGERVIWHRGEGAGFVLRNKVIPESIHSIKLKNRYWLSHPIEFLRVLPERVARRWGNCTGLNAMIRRGKFNCMDFARKSLL